jgi:hypothetical protein
LQTLIFYFVRFEEVRVGSFIFWWQERDPHAKCSLEPSSEPKSGKVGGGFVLLVKVLGGEVFGETGWLVRGE